MASVNKVIILGNLGRDPELRYTPSGSAVCNVSIATTRNWKSREGGERQEETEWHRVVFYDRLAEIAGEYLKKGRPVYVEGRLKTRKWQDKEGNERQTTEVVADRMQMLGGRSSGNAYEAMDDMDQSAPPPQQQRQSASAPAQKPVAAPASGSGFDDFEDDIPF